MRSVASSGLAVEYLVSVESTNTVARQRADEGRDEPLWIVGGQQTGGKGRQGRQWASPPGNLYASLLWFHRAPARRLPSLSLVAGLAVLDAFAATDADCTFELKWPNDVLANGRKISGVLVESVGPASHGGSAILGCGLNLSHHPDGVRWPATNLAELGSTISPAAMFDLLDSTLQARLAQWDNGLGIEGIRRDWLASAAWFGEVLVAGGTEGKFTGLSDEGALVLTLHDGEPYVHHAGDVTWPGKPAMTASR